MKSFLLREVTWRPMKVVTILTYALLKIDTNQGGPASTETGY
jgi:hypothetical protein